MCSRSEKKKSGRGNARKRRGEIQLEKRKRKSGFEREKTRKNDTGISVLERDKQEHLERRRETWDMIFRHDLQIPKVFFLIMY